MKPIEFQGANKIFKGDRVADLPAYQTKGMIVSRWRANLWERLAILLYGTIWVCIIGEGQPPIAISGYQSCSFTNPYYEGEQNERQSD